MFAWVSGAVEGWWVLGEGVFLKQLFESMGPEEAVVNITALAHTLLAGVPWLLDAAGALTDEEKGKEAGRYLSGLAFGLPWLPRLWR